MCCENIPKEKYHEYLTIDQPFTLCQTCGTLFDTLFHALCWKCNTCGYCGEKHE